MDPLAADFASISPYAYVLNNPVKYVDPDGKVPILPYILGGGAGALLEIGIQVTANVATGQRPGKIDWADVGVSALAGMTGGGLMSKIPKLTNTIAIIAGGTACLLYTSDAADE